MITELRPYQTEALDALRSSIGQGVYRVMLQAPTGAGKCLGIGTPVLKYDGSIVPVESIVDGDVLMGPDSRPRSVSGVTRGYGPLFRISPVKGDSWVCNDVHVLTLVETGSGATIDIPLNEYLRTSKTFRHTHKLYTPSSGIDFEEVKDPDIPAYFLGLWIGDGTKALRGVSISKPDIEVLEECQRVAAVNGGRVRVSQSGSCPTYHLVTPRGQCNTLLTRMREVMGGGRIPREILTSSREYRLQLLAGIIDTDGYVANGCCEIAQRSTILADGISFLARSLGLKVTRVDKTVNGVVYQRMMLSGHLSDIPTRINRKTAKGRKQKKCATRTGFAVSLIGNGEFAGFELDGDGRFMLGDFTVTHNTKIAAAIVDGAIRKNNRMAFVVSSISLIDQAMQSFYDEGISEIGVIQAQHEMTDWSKPVQICSVQTLNSRKAYPEAKVVVFDEAHVLHGFHKKWLEDPEWQKVPFVGLSATPWAKGLGKYFHSLLVVRSTKELIDEGYLSKFKVFATGHPDLSGVKVSRGDYVADELSGAMQQGTLVADIIETYKERWGKGKTLCFGVDCAHAQALQTRFLEAGISCAYQDARTPSSERNEIKRKFHNGEYDVICNVMTMTVGIDYDVRCLILARPTKSEMLYTQIIGRALRTAEGKDHAIILDHSDTTLRLGLVTDIYHDSLDDGKDKPKAAKQVPLPKECKSCGYLKPPRTPVCPNCGFKPEVTSSRFERDGELVEIVPGMALPKRKKANGDAMTMEERAAFFAELKCHCRAKGYKEGWSAAKYKDRFGVWPERSIKHIAPAPYVTLKTQLWIKHTQIAWAHSKKNQANQGGLIV